ncbi:MAG: hypothetical protein J5535_03805 [Firmicutes bacterium]|nr:hypothetical protein [Bacillota bacterium]
MKKFSKILSLLLVLAMVLSLAACGTPANNTPAGNDNNANVEPGKVEPDPNYPASGVLTTDIAYAAGGTTDRVCRQLSAQIAELLKCASNCQNVTGSSASVAGVTVLEEGKKGDVLLGVLNPAPSSWYTLGFTDESHWSDWYTFVAVQSTFALMVKGDSKYNTAQDLFDDIKANPGTIKCGTSGLGTAVHLSCEMLLAAIGGEVITVPYSGGSESAKNVIAGEVTFMWASYSDVIDYLKSGDLKCIGTVDQNPITMTKSDGTSYEMPSLYKDYPDAAKSAAALGYYGIAVPRYVDDAQVLALKNAFEKVVATDEFKKFAQDCGLKPVCYTGEDADKLMSMAESLYAWAIYDNGLAAQGRSPADIKIPRIADYSWDKIDFTNIKAWPAQ